MKQLLDLYFTTATILNWIPLLKENEYKDIVIGSFRYAVQNKRANILAFVIMNNHIHLVWQILPPYELGKVRQSMLKYTAQQFKFNLLKNKSTSNLLEKFKVDKIDRTYQFWMKKPLSVAIYTEKVLHQKINYIHKNLLRKGLDDIKYKYSSAYYYETGKKNWDFLS